MKRLRPFAWLACATTCAAIALVPVATVQAQQSIGWQTRAPFAQRELDQMLAPIALYPDALLAQVLMAATYPLEVVQASRFVQRNPGLSDEALARAVAPMGWDPSVAALTQFPSVLAMMDEQLAWTERLGEAFLAQREQVMDTVQTLRARAHASGSLRTTEHQRVIVENRVIVIEPWRAGAYWVPYYNPSIVFGAWWWPAHPPFLWVPPAAYRPRYFAEVYTVGIVWGPIRVVFGSLWNDPRPVWRDRHVVIDDRRVTNVIITRSNAPQPLLWRHDHAHRRGAEYRSPVVRERYLPPSPPRVSKPVAAPPRVQKPTPPERQAVPARPQARPQAQPPAPPRSEPRRGGNPRTAPDPARNRPQPADPQQRGPR